MELKRTRRRWTWVLSAFLVFALTGCGMYPSKPGDWPSNFWGTVLHSVSEVIDFFAHHLGDSYGLAILIVTVIVRLIILPLFIRQLRYQRVMMELQPEMQKIRAKHKGDNQKIQQETMKLYQEAGTNPAAGCLPTLIQLPVLYALYGAIMGNSGLHHSTFLKIFPLGQHDPHYILPVVAGITTFVSSWLTMKNSPQQQKAILYIMPLFIIFIGARLPSGLVLYWVYTNLFTALQTYIFLTRPSAAKAREVASTAVMDVKPGNASGSSRKSSTGRSDGQKKVSGGQASGSKKSTSKSAASKSSSKSASGGSSKSGTQRTSKGSSGSSKRNSGSTSRKSTSSGNKQSQQKSQPQGTSNQSTQSPETDASSDHSSDGRSR